MGVRGALSDLFAVASAFWANSAWVSTATKDDNFSNTGCTAPFNDAAAQVYSGNMDATGDVGFKIIFQR